jgi:hypothetical protein
MPHRGSGWLLPSVALATACASPAIPPDAEPPTPAALAAEPALAPATLPAPGEELTFAIDLAGLPVGTATLVTSLDHGALRLDAEGGTNAVVDFFYAVRGVARARLDPTGRSRSFYLRMEEDGKQSERMLAFGDFPRLTYMPWNDDSWVASLTQYREPRDPLSLLMEVRKLEPTAEPRDFEVAMTLRSFCYRARYLGRANASVDAGTFPDAMQWRVEVRPYRELGETTEVGPIVGFYDVVVSADSRRLPLRLAREFGFGQVALELESAGVSRPESGVAHDPFDLEDAPAVAAGVAHVADDGSR